MWKDLCRWTLRNSVWDEILRYWRNFRALRNSERKTQKVCPPKKKAFRRNASKMQIQSRRVVLRATQIGKPQNANVDMMTAQQIFPLILSARILEALNAAQKSSEVLQMFVLGLRLIREIIYGDTWMMTWEGFVVIVERSASWNSKENNSIDTTQWKSRNTPNMFRAVCWFIVHPTRRRKSCSTKSQSGELKPISKAQLFEKHLCASQLQRARCNNKKFKIFSAMTFSIRGDDVKESIKTWKWFIAL